MFVRIGWKRSKFFLEEYEKRREIIIDFCVGLFFEMKGESERDIIFN